MDYTQELEILKKELFDVNMRLKTVNNDEEKNKLLKLKEEIKQSMAKIMIAKELNKDDFNRRGIEYDKYKRR